MIVQSGREVGAHLLFNGSCDVIGRRVMQLITTELGWSLGFFNIFPKEIRPIHCAILLRNERIVKALIEENLNMKQIKICDIQSETNYRTELTKLVSRNLSYFFGQNIFFGLENL